METKTPLAELPGMDEHKIGPAGETFAQLKDAVREHRAAFQAKLMRGEADAALMERYDVASRMLQAAYTRVGLPYVAP